MIDVITQSTDFTRVLDAPCRARSAHFAVHHLACAPGVKPRGRKASVPSSEPTENAELSTARGTSCALPVDESLVDRCWLGLVVPKRHARRAVTRTLLKRRIRLAVADSAGLPPGMWVVRLRNPFVRTTFVSAASEALSDAVTNELQTLMSAALAKSR